MMSTTLPLLWQEDPTAALLWRDGATISRGAFAAAALALAERLPDAEFVVNRCRSRYGFTLTLLASAVRGRPCRLVDAAAPGTRDQTWSDAVEVSDDAAMPAAVQITTPGTPTGFSTLPEIPATRAVAVVYTSGSTGQPRSHIKTWAALWHAGRAIADHILGDLPPMPILATVPMHHMYGLEATVALPLTSPFSVIDARPAFPEDIRRRMERLAQPAVLVTTPIHLRALLMANVALPGLRRIISATAPLPLDLAIRVEQAFGVPVMEVYGCTEAGSIASRRSVDGPLWTPLTGIDLRCERHEYRVYGPHLAEPVQLDDHIIRSADGRFRMRGRSSDMVKVCGKRASLTDLNDKLLSIPGVIDGVMFQPEPDAPSGGSAVLQRLAAVVVAPDLSDGELLARLADLIDPVFLPRPLRCVARLPRNETGKLPRETLRRLLADA